MRLFVLALLVGCGSDKAPEDTGGDTGADTPTSPVVAGASTVDVLLVVDNSSSMMEQGANLAMAVPTLVSGLSTRSPDGHVGVVTVDVFGEEGAAKGVYAISDPDLAAKLVDDILCKSVCVGDEGLLFDDPSYSCGDPITRLSKQVMECTCGPPPDWVGRSCGSAQKQGIEAAYLALCQAVAEPPAECFETELSEFDIGTNEGLLTEGAVVPVVFSDEGDGSSRLTGGDAGVDPYPALFEALGVAPTWVVAGPDLDGAGEPVCGGPATGWGSQRYQTLAETTGGAYLPITDAACSPALLGPIVEAILAAVDTASAGD